jgi:hypothetical protein
MSADQGIGLALPTHSRPTVLPVRWRKADADAAHTRNQRAIVQKVWSSRK